MLPDPHGLSSDRLLDILDIDADEEQAYRWLLGHPHATAQDLAQDLPLPPRKALRLLDALEDKGLATHTPERPRRYIPASPGIAMESLILERQEKLQRARSAVQELEKHAKAAQPSGNHEPMVELVTSREAGRQIIEQMDRTAKHEIITLIRPPILITPIGEPDRAEIQAKARGVRYRSIADTQCLAIPDVAVRIREDVKAGEDVRVFPQLPFKMVLADRRIAFIPLNLQKPDTPSLLVRSSSLLDALYALFEILWERAAPIPASPVGVTRDGGPEAMSDGETEELLALLASGLNDKAVAHRLGISERTLGRRVVELMRGFDARTRFQAGWLAAWQVFRRDKTAPRKRN
jgi:sugar-specific transcriptional regulator TrmB